MGWSWHHDRRRNRAPGVTAITHAATRAQNQPENTSILDGVEQACPGIAFVHAARPEDWVMARRAIGDGPLVCAAERGWFDRAHGFNLASFIMGYSVLCPRNSRVPELPC